MDISVVVDRSPSPAAEPGREEGGRSVRLNVEDRTEGMVRLGRLLRTLAGILERSRSRSGEVDAEEDGETSLHLALKIGSETRSERPDPDGDRQPGPLALRLPPRGSGSSLSRADLEFVGHELRTPINAVMGYTSLLRERVYGDLSADQAEAVERIRAAARNLVSALDHLGKVAELDLGRFEGNPDGGDGSESPRTGGGRTL